MKHLEPLDDGRRSYRPGLWLAILAVLVLGGGVLFWKGHSDQPKPEPLQPPVVLAEPKPEPEPEINLHPLRGFRRIFLADGCLYRYEELTFRRDFSTQHSFPGAFLHENDPCRWEFVPVDGVENVYRIYCADPNFPQYHRANLTYTRLVDKKGYRNDHPPYLTLRNDDPCQWKVRTMGPNFPHQYEIYCMMGEEPFVGQSLGWMTKQEDLKSEMVTATLGQNGNPSWFILPEGDSPKRPPLATHLIVMPKAETESLQEARASFAKKGHEIFRLKFRVKNDEFERTSEKISLAGLVRKLRGQDSVIEHPKFPPLLSAGDLIGLIEGQDELFPLIFPLKIGVQAHLIEKLILQNTDTLLWASKLDQADDFAQFLDESGVSDGRVFETENFHFFFISHP